jgi:serine/threonine protein kinase
MSHFHRERLGPEIMIAMPYYRHGSIDQAGITAEEKCIKAFGQILDGRHHLSTKKIAHRDLKPENILVELLPYFKVVIADFGLSKATTEFPMLYTFCGTLTYAAPEVFPHNNTGYGPLSDV